MSAAIVTGRGGERAQEEAERPLSELAAQGWEVQHYSACLGDSGMMEHCFHLRRQSESRVLMVRKKMMGRGYATELLDL